MGSEAQEAAACNACGASFDGTHSNPNAMEIPDQHAHPEEYITSDEEERRRQGYDINTYYEQTDQAREFKLEGTGVESHFTYEPNANIIAVNRGLRSSDDDNLDEFVLCTEGNQRLKSDSQDEDHMGDDGDCYANAANDAIRRDVELYTAGGHDTVTVTTPLPEWVDQNQQEEFYTTLKEALYQGILHAFDLDEEEIETFTRPATDHGSVTIVIYETSEGGVGALHDLMDDTRLNQMVREAQIVLHGEPDDDGCERACYECLLSFYNQSEHEVIDRTLVDSWLEKMTGVKLKYLPGNTLSEEDFDGLLAACDSSFEKKVLHEIRDGGYELPDEAQHTLYDGDEPVAKPDFFYDRSGASIAVFVDGAVHQRDYVSDDDEEKRTQLRRMGYRVISVTEVAEVSDMWESI
jgi:hypothetical protein